MSLTHILNTIEQKTDEEINNIKKQAKEEKQAVLNDAQEEAKKIKEIAKNNLQEETQEKIIKAQRQADNQVKNKILLKKKEILDNVFAKAVSKLAQQEVDLEQLYKKLIAELPTDKTGQILTTDSTALLIKKLAPKFPIKTELKEEGFKFIGAMIEIDNRLSRLIEEVRDDAEIEVAKILFE